MFTSTAYAATPGIGGQGGLGAFLPLVVLFGIFYFLLIRPQQKKTKAHQATLDALQPNDTIITNGGVFGTVIKIEGNVVTIQCSDRVRLKIIKKAISSKVDPETMGGADTNA